MAILRCPKCSQQLQVPDTPAGKSIVCPFCHVIFDQRVPTQGAVKPIVLGPSAASSLSPTTARPRPAPVNVPIAQVEEEGPASEIEDVEESHVPRRGRKKKLRRKKGGTAVFGIVAIVAVFILLVLGGAFLVSFILERTSVDTAKVWDELGQRPGVIPAMPRHAPADVARDLAKDFRRENMVAFAFTGMDGYTDLTESVLERLRKLVHKPRGYGSAIRTEKVYAFLVGVDDLDEFAKQIDDFARVTRIDKENRVIVLAVNRSWLASLKEQRRENPLETAVADLNSTNMLTREKALEVFLRSPPDEKHRAAVIDALVNRRPQPAIEIEKLDVDVIRRWAEPDQLLTYLTRLLEDEQTPFGKGHVLNAMGDLKDERAIPTLARFITHTHREGKEAVDALRRFGARAEDAVLERLDPKDLFSAEYAIILLGEIGTAKSLAKLELCKKDFHHGDRVRVAIDKIKSRMEK